MRKLTLLFLVVFLCFQVSAQSRKKDQEVEIVNHEVQLGESVRMISKKYLVDPAEIYKLNKFAVDGISQGMILKIPVPVKEKPVVQQEENAQPTETTPENPIEEKPVVQKQVPVKITQKTDEQSVGEVEKPKQQAVVYERTSDTHTVVPKETLFSLSRRYGVTVDAIKANNPELQNGGLKVGQVIKIPPAGNGNPSTNADVAVNTAVPEKKMPIKAEPVASNTTAGTETITHVVAPKETLYSLSKKYNVTVDEIKQQNQALLSKGLQIGQTLTIRKQ